MKKFTSLMVILGLALSSNGLFALESKPSATNQSPNTNSTNEDMDASEDAETSDEHVTKVSKENLNAEPEEDTEASDENDSDEDDSDEDDSDEDKTKQSSTNNLKRS